MSVRAILLLGAGASAPFGIPTSGQFVGAFLEAHQEHRELWQSVVTGLGEAGYKGGIDLEAAMSLLEAISDSDPKGHLAKTAGLFPVFCSGADIDKRLSRIDGGRARDMAGALRAFVRQKCENPDFTKVKEVFDRLMEGFSELVGTELTSSSNGPRYPSWFDCFTTNYDFVFENYLRKNKRQFQTGYALEDGEVTYRPYLFSKETPYWVVHLHGSVRMWSLGDGSVIDSEIAPGRKTLADGRAVGAEAMVYPVLDKELIRFPFTHMFSLFHERIAYPDTFVILTVGFSFRDEAILRILEDACRESQRLYVLSEDAQETSARISKRLRCGVVPIPSLVEASGLVATMAAQRDANPVAR